MIITVEDLVRREVYYCVSSLVSTLVGNGLNGDLDGPLGDLCGQAFELATPVLDYEEAAREAGWQDFKDNMVCRKATLEEREADGSTHRYADGYEEACQEDDIEPYEWDVFEHWIVSDWLADKLAERGEKIDKDFAGMIVWARTTTGQGIAADAVIEAIHADLIKY